MKAVVILAVAERETTRVDGRISVITVVVDFRGIEIREAIAVSVIGGRYCQ
jgi:hypothetical protein